MDKDCKADFETVLEGELKLLDELRKDTASGEDDDVFQRARDLNLAGLAFSGGGIRSATFNLGVIQALSRYGVLARFDYLSTVSGGGYIGGWLSALLHRKAATNGIVTQQDVENFQSCLKPHPKDSGSECSDKVVGFPPVEHMAVRYLRRYSNYLSPRLGMSGDMLAVISIFFRNLTLIQLALISLVASILLLAHTFVVGTVLFTNDTPWLLTGLQHIAAFLGFDLPQWLRWLTVFISSSWLYVASALALFFSVWWTGRLMAQRGIHYDKRTTASLAVHYRVILPCILAAWWFSAAIVTRPNVSLFEADSNWHTFLWISVPGICYAGAWILGFYSKWRVIRNEKRLTSDDEEVSKIGLLIATLCSGVLFGVLIYAAHCYIKQVSSARLIDVWYAVGFGTPLFILGLSFVVTLHIGAVRRCFTEDDREWLARLGGFLLMYAAGWALLFSLVLYATSFVHWLAAGGLVALVTWAVGSGLGARFASGSSTNEDTDSIDWKGMISLIAPWLFVAGLAVIVTYGTQVVLLEVLTDSGYVQPADNDFSIAVSSILQQLHELPVLGTLLAFVCMSILFVVICLRLDINLFSMHALYSNRLARAYLGASCAGKRKPNPFTGFDIDDDPQFADLAQQRPVHIINSAINMTGGDDLAWQTRRAASFSFTPCWSGYETISSQGKKLGTFRPTRQYAKGRSLGTWVAVSGAAASPNMGYHTSAAVAALMTAFNLRLGRWCGNPDPVGENNTVWKQRSPRIAAQPIISELTGLANARSDWINLTDGGHFENLGVYELIRRRCRLIVVTDAGCDPEHKFEDLANLVRKCWVDFGVNVRFDNFEPMHLKKNSRFCGALGAVGRIQYNEGDTEGDGVIIYLKASMTGDEWPDIRQYADSHKSFPHETTADQFFDENQFEAYRHLGYKVAARAVTEMNRKLKLDMKDAPIVEIVEKLLENMQLFELAKAE
jgi:hypothetical protein